MAPALAVVVLGVGACSVLGGGSTTQPSSPGSSSAGSAQGPASSSVTPSRSASSSASPTSTAPSSTSTPSEPRPADCAELVGRLSLPERVGQLLMVSVSSSGLTSSGAALIGRTHAGSVLLLGNTTAGMDAAQQVVSDVRAAADRPQRVTVVVAADQEGGLVQRLAGSGFEDIPSAVRQARLPDAELRREAVNWGTNLDKAGVNLDLAPVADVVPAGLVGVNQPIGVLRRGYGPRPGVVARKVKAFTAGMDDAGIATAVKHFPGLGRVRGNTDTQARVVDQTTVRKDPALAGFTAAVGAGVDMVMVSSATYSRIDARRQAVFSPTVIQRMVRGDLDFDGVVISDDLAARGVSDVPARQRVVRFVEAGGDLAIVADPQLAETSADALVAKAESDPDFAARVDESARRVLAFKDRRGLAHC